MPDYKTLPINTEISALVNGKYKGKKVDEVDQVAAKKDITAILNKYVKQGLENAKLRLQYVTQEHDSCKQTLKRMEALLEELKAPNYIPEGYKLHECKAGLNLIGIAADAVHKDGTTMFAKMSEFRASWSPTASKICKDVKFLDAFIAVRTQSMMLGKQAEGLEERIVEYKKRAELVAAEAEKVRNGSDQTNKDLVVEANKLVAIIETAEATAKEALKLATNKVRTLTGMKNQALWNGLQLKVAESVVVDIEKERKTVAGQHKTADQARTRLLPMIQAKSFILAPTKEKLDKAWPLLEGYKNDAAKAKTDADEVLKELAKRPTSK